MSLSRLFIPSAEQGGPMTATLATSGAALSLSGAALSLVGIQLFTSADPIGRTLRAFQQLAHHENKLTTSDNVNKGIDHYNALHAPEDAEGRNSEYKSLVNSYYDLATVFFEWGWGDCFHFSFRYAFESFHEGIRRHEYFLASRLGLTKGDKVLDVGCGIGGPMRNISRFTTNDVTGITLNPYQVERGNELCRRVGLGDQCRSVQGDFMEMPFEGNTFDAAYAIEATCHAPDRNGVYREIYRVLKPGAIFACYEWCLTDSFDHSDPNHLRIKKQIEEGDGLPDIVHTSVCLQSLREAGFDILEEGDLHAPGAEGTKSGVKPWYLPMVPSWNPWSQRFQFNWFGHRLTNVVIALLETLYLAPKGTVKTQRTLQKAAFGLSDSGQLGILTTAYLMVGRVPMNKKGGDAAAAEAAAVKQ